MSALSSAAQAASPDYSFVEASYIDKTLKVDHDFFEPYEADADGIDLQGMYGLSEYLFVQGGYQRVSGEYNEADEDAIYHEKQQTNLAYAGLGLRFPLNDMLDFNATVSYLRADIKESDRWTNIDSTGASETYFDSDSDTSEGYRLGVALRAQVTEELELATAYDHDLFSDDDGFEHSTVTVKGVYRLNEVLSLQAAYITTEYKAIGDQVDVNEDSWQLGVRYSF